MKMTRVMSRVSISKTMVRDQISGPNFGSKRKKREQKGPNNSWEQIGSNTELYKTLGPKRDQETEKENENENVFLKLLLTAVNRSK